MSRFEPGTGEAPLDSLPHCVASWAARFALSPGSASDIGSAAGSTASRGILGIVVLGASGRESLLRALDWCPSVPKTVRRIHETDWPRWQDAVQPARSRGQRSTPTTGAHPKAESPRHAVAFTTFLERTCFVAGRWSL